MPRSEKPAFKPQVVKKDNTDQQTKDEKEYLGEELFTMLKEAKIKTKDEDQENPTQITEQTDSTNQDSSKKFGKGQKPKVSRMQAKLKEGLAVLVAQQQKQIGV